MGRKIKPLAEILARHVKQPSGCWEWQGAKNQIGYGIVLRTIDGKARIKVAHRLAYEEWRGQIPDGLNVLHTCDNRCCINPDHLWLGTQAENMRDMVAKGRHSSGHKARRAAEEQRAKAEAEAAEAAAQWLKRVA